MSLLALTECALMHGQRALIHALSFTVQAGESWAVLGASGMGKSTLLRTLAGVQAPLSGRVLLSDHDLHKLPQRELAKHLAVVLTERVNTDAMTARELVALGRHPHTDWSGSLRALDHERIDWAMHATNTISYASRNVNELSDGERQRVLIARALAQEPQVMLLDEPTAFLDLPRRVEVLQLLRELAHKSGRAFLLSTHDLDLALHLADRVWLLSSDGAF
ncbi:MAG: ABC transporter ATP-binding protein [Limnobacter sp.]|nr:ABC transporter ATP-binding protein [Limnobacter sp.]